MHDSSDQVAIRRPCIAPSLQGSKPSRAREAHCLSAKAASRLLAALLLGVPLLTYSDNPGALRQEAENLTRLFQEHLLSTVSRAIAEEGPEQAVRSCRTLAPLIAQQHSIAPWKVGRTSLRLRNPANQPDAWEQEVLEEFQRRVLAGEPISNLTRTQVVDGEFRYMRAIGIAGPCLTCHGKAIKPEIAQVLDQVYPQDRARGFELGELRGAFTLRRPLNSGE